MKYLSKTLTALILGSAILVSIPSVSASAATSTSPINSGQASVAANATGWQKVGNSWYYYVNGVKQTGWIHPDSWYYLDSNGVMQTGWQKIDGKWYYFNTSGAMQTGWQKVDNKWYYLNSDGVMQTDWQQIDGKWYYFNASGEMQTGWVQAKYDKNKYYYLKSSGEMAVSEPVDNNQYYVDASGAWYNTNAQKVIDMACRQLGKSYVYGATGPDTFDCSGLTQYCYQQALGIDISRTTYTQINQGIAVPKDQLQPGDLVFPNTGHVQIYIGDGKVIHAPHTGDVVRIAPLGNFYAGRRIL